MKLFIDFETYSECSLDDCGAYVYANHPSTDLLSMSYCFGHDGEIHNYKHLEGDTLPNDVRQHVENGGIISAHNAFFDYCIWQYVCVPKHGWPSSKLEQWEDTMAKAASHSLPLSLEKCADAMRLDVKKDTISGRILNKLARPQYTKDGRMFRHYPSDSPDSYKTLYIYNDRDVAVARLIDKRIPDLSPEEWKIWFFTQRINHRGIYVDVESIKEILPRVEKEKEQFNARATEITKGVITKITQVQRIKKYANAKGVDLPNTQKETLEHYLTVRSNELPEEVREILEMRLMGGKSSTGKYEAMLKSAHCDQRVRGTLVYCGAIKTGRWAGRQVQPHNFPKPTVKYESIEELIDDLRNSPRDQILEKYGSLMHAASTATRGMICAPPGKILNVADYNAIEVRILFWLADEQEGLKVYREGGDIYVEMAKDVYGNPNLTKSDSDERWLGKQIILGCGYGMGPPKFMVTCAGYGRSITEDLSQKAVYSYREKYYKVVELWNGIEEAAMKAMTAPFNIEEYGYVKFKKIGQHLYCKLPSGRKIVYPYARLERVKTPWGAVKLAITYRTLENGMWKRTSTFGGKLVENVCQGVARDFMAHGMITAEEKGGYEMVTTVHDEAVSETPRDYGDIEEYCELLVDIPDWGKGCPLEAEGKRVQRYQKI